MRKMSSKRRRRLSIPVCSMIAFSLLVHFNRENDAFEYITGAGPILFLMIYETYLDKYDND